MSCLRIVEDVTCEGLLVVYQKDDLSQEDSGLRFREVDETHFVCPGCRPNGLNPGLMAGILPGCKIWNPEGSKPLAGG